MAPTETEQRVIDDTAEWRAKTSSELAQANERMTAMESQHKAMKATIDVNTMATLEGSNKVDTLAKDLEGIILFSKRVNGSFELGKSFGGLAFWLAKMSAAGAIVWAIFKYAVGSAGK